MDLETSATPPRVEVDVGAVQRTLPSEVMIRLSRARASLGAKGAMLIALLPVVVAGVHVNGSPAFLVLAVASLTSMLAGVAHRALARQPLEWVHPGSIISGLLVGLTCAPNTPLSFIAIGALASEVVGKHLGRRRGRNLLNPAALGRLVVATLLAFWPTARLPDIVTGASPLMLDAGGHGRPEWSELLWGHTHVAIGEASMLAVLISGALVLGWVIMKREATLAMLATVPVVLLVALPTPEIVGHAQWTLHPMVHVLGSSILFSAFFFASDPVTTPNTRFGGVVFGLGAGTASVLARLYTSIPGAEMYGVLIMNLASPWLDRRFSVATTISTEPEPSGASVTRERVGRATCVPQEIVPEHDFSTYAGLAELPDPRRLLELVDLSGLRGCGGGHFSVAEKWRAALTTSGQRVLIINGQEGEPGSSKDVLLMELVPHLVLEGAVVAATALDAKDVLIVVTPEAPKALARMRESAADLGARSPSLRVEVVLGSGAYIAGEETALLAHHEGRAPEPRLRPPFPHERGLFARPTVVHNVETVAWIPVILDRGPRWFAEHGGYKLVTLSGGARDPGVYAAHFEMSLSDLVRMGGGVDGELVAYAVGGPSGGLIPPALGDTPYSLEAMREAGAAVGSGAVRVLVAPSCPLREARDALRFFAEESCQKCAPCRLGTVVLADTLDRVIEGRASPTDLWNLEELSAVVSATSACGLGTGASNVLRSVVRHWPGAIEDHLHRRCNSCG